jgi:hypothetical protein
LRWTQKRYGRDGKEKTSCPCCFDIGGLRVASEEGLGVPKEVISSRKLFFWRFAKRSVIIHNTYRNKMWPIGFVRYEVVLFDKTKMQQLTTTLHVY